MHLHQWNDIVNPEIVPQTYNNYILTKVHKQFTGRRAFSVSGVGVIGHPQAKSRPPKLHICTKVDHIFIFFKIFILLNNQGGTG